MEVLFTFRTAKSTVMHKDYTFRLLFCLAFFILLKITCFAAGKGYLITKDEKFITGQVIAVNSTETSSELVFVNDFGDYYQIHPFLIKGFVFTEKEKVIQYESKFNGQYWMFLRIEVAGNGIRMYKTDNIVYSMKSRFDDNYQKTQSVSKQIWLEQPNGTPFQIYILGFRKTMRGVLADFPELAVKIGEKGYRYKNLKSILTEYNEWYEATRLML